MISHRQSLLSINHNDLSARDKICYYNIKVQEEINLKNKYSIIRFIFGILTIILCIIALIYSSTYRPNTQVLMNFMFICLGIFQILNGIHFYKQNKKSHGILLILSGMFIFSVIVKIAIL